MAASGAPAAAHSPVLLEEVCGALGPAMEGLHPRHVVDATGGRGGHSAALLDRMEPGDRLIILDRDPEAIAALASRFGGDPRVSLFQERFDRLEQILSGAALAGRVDAILADLGVSSPQLDDAARGFSFLRDGPLDMRMNPGEGQSAAEWLSEAGAREISQVLRDFGEEGAARAIAQAIVRRREDAPLLRTRDLADLIAGLLPQRAPGIHPATRTFQAIRIHINDELGQLQRFLPQAFRALRPGGRLAIISFHSLEDRIVKRFFRAEEQQPDHRIPLRSTELPPRPWTGISRAIKASAEEMRANPRARSATLRYATKNPEIAHAT